MVRPCPECRMTKRHKMDCDIARRQRRGDLDALVATFDVPAEIAESEPATPWSPSECAAPVTDSGSSSWSDSSSSSSGGEC